MCWGPISARQCKVMTMSATEENVCLVCSHSSWGKTDNKQTEEQVLKTFVVDNDNDNSICQLC